MWKAKIDPFKTKVVLYGIIALLSLPLQAQIPSTAKSRQPDYFQWLKSRQDQQDFSRIVLKNGLRVLVAESHEAPLAVVGLYLPIGNDPENAREVVLGELAMRLLFSGSAKRTARQLADQLWASVHSWWVETRPDRVVLWMIFDSSELTRNIEAIADMINGSVWDDASLTKVRNGVNYEWHRQFAKQITGSPSDGSYGFFWWGIRSLQPWMAKWESIGVDQLVSWRLKNFTANNLIVVFYGDFSAETVIREAVRRCKDFPMPSPGGSLRGESRAIQVAKPSGPLPDSSYVCVTTDVNRAVLQIRYAIPPSPHPDLPAIAAASQLLASGPGSWLHRRLVEEKKIATYLKTELVDYPSLPGWLLFQAEGAPNQIDALEIEFFSGMENFRKAEITDRDAAQAMAYAQMGFYLRLETPWGRAGHLLNIDLEGGNKAWWSIQERVRQLKAKDLSQAATRYLSLGQAFTREILPGNTGVRNYTPASFRDTMKKILDLTVEPVAAVGNKKFGEEFIDSSWRPKSKNAPISQASVPERTSILRGPELQVWENPSLPVVDIGIFFAGGIDLEAGDQAGMTRLLLRCLLHAEEGSPLEQELYSLRIHGGTIQPIANKEYSGYLLHIPPGQAWASLDLVRHMLNNRSFKEEDVEFEMRQLQAEAVRLQDDSDIRLRNLFDQKLYGAHPYGRSGYPDPAGNRQWKAAQLLEHHTQLIENKLPMVIVLGDTNGTELAGYFVKHYSSSRYSLRNPQWPSTTVPKEKQKVNLVQDKPTGDSAFLFLGPEGDNEETWVIMAALETLEREMTRNTIPPLWGQAGITLADFHSAGRGGLIAFSSNPLLDVSAEAPGRLLELLRKFPATIRDNDWQRAKARLQNRMIAETQTRFGLMMFLAQGYFTHRQFLTPLKTAAKLDAVSLNDFRETVERFFTQEKYVEVCW